MDYYKYYKFIVVKSEKEYLYLKNIDLVRLF